MQACCSGEDHRQGVGGRRSEPLRLPSSGSAPIPILAAPGAQSRKHNGRQDGEKSPQPSWSSGRILHPLQRGGQAERECARCRDDSAERRREGDEGPSLSRSLRGAGQARVSLRAGHPAGEGRPRKGFGSSEPARRREEREGGHQQDPTRDREIQQGTKGQARRVTSSSRRGRAQESVQAIDPRPRVPVTSCSHQGDLVHLEAPLAHSRDLRV